MPSNDFVSICILGRQPELGIAELESLLGADAIMPLGSEAVLVNIPAQDIPLHRLGGTIKVCKLLTFLPFTDWQSVSGHLLDNIEQHLQFIPEGKIRLGLSCHGLNSSVRAINATGLALKRVIRANGRSVRVVPNKTMGLNSAQILHNQLTGPTGLELVAVRDKNRTALAQTVNIQDIEAYAARDQKRPKRDARVGMLPPKLAQIIINLAVNESSVISYPLSEKEQTTDNGQLTTMRHTVVLDPFCGTGVLLQEAMLMGYDGYGTDIEDRMIEYTNANLEWLSSQFALSGKYYVEAGDATIFRWTRPFSAVATEAYLGQPLSRLPGPARLKQLAGECDQIFERFLRNLSTQVSPGLRLCVAVPAWKTPNGFWHLPSLDRLEKIGYTRTSFVHTNAGELMYHRPGQIVARELVVLTKN